MCLAGDFLVGAMVYVLLSRLSGLQLGGGHVVLDLHVGLAARHHLGEVGARIPCAEVAKPGGQNDDAVLVVELVAIDPARVGDDADQIRVGLGDLAVGEGGVRIAEVVDDNLGPLQALIFRGLLEKLLLEKARAEPAGTEHHDGKEEQEIYEPCVSAIKLSKHGMQSLSGGA